MVNTAAIWDTFIPFGNGIAVILMPYQELRVLHSDLQPFLGSLFVYVTSNSPRRKVGVALSSVHSRFHAFVSFSL
jgi:hypothetical protein